MQGERELLGFLLWWWWWWWFFKCRFLHLSRKARITDKGSGTLF